MVMTRRPRRIAVASDQSLVAEAVRTALSSRGFDAFVLTWARPRRQPPPGHVSTELADAGLMLCDLEPSPRLREARALASAQAEMPWLLLTAAAQGPLWGALLDRGVDAVLSNATTLDEVVLTLPDLMEGRTIMADEDKDALVREWRAARSEKDLLLARMQSLTPRERTVLRLLYAGDGVRSIADMLDVSEATVRSHVKAVLQKLKVNSQLAAVAALGWLQDDPECRDPWSVR